MSFFQFFCFFWFFHFFEGGTRKKRKERRKRLGFIIFKRVVPFEAGCGAERWVGLAGLAIECGPVTTTTSTLMTTHCAVTLTPSLCKEMTQTVETVWVTRLNPMLHGPGSSRATWRCQEHQGSDQLSDVGEPVLPMATRPDGIGLVEEVAVHS